jgi:hypothetical protein
MSYNLYFYKETKNTLTEERAAEILNEIMPFNISDDPRQWDYENPATGVHFMIDWNKADSSDSEKEIQISSEFQNLNFNLSVNYFRPAYFGYEIFSFIDLFVTRLDARIINPQDEEDPEQPKIYSRDHILKQWNRINDMFILGDPGEEKFNFMPLEKSNDFWWYQFHRNEMEMKITEDLYVPGILLLKNNDDGLLYTACVWTMHIPTVLPLVDYVIIQKKYTKISGDIEETGIVKYEEIIKRFGSYFDVYEGEVPDLKILYQRNADKLANDFNNMPLLKHYEEFGTLVQMGSFVNVKS